MFSAHFLPVFIEIIPAARRYHDLAGIRAALAVSSSRITCIWKHAKRFRLMLRSRPTRTTNPGHRAELRLSMPLEEVEITTSSRQPTASVAVLEARTVTLEAVGHLRDAELRAAATVLGVC